MKILIITIVIFFTISLSAKEIKYSLGVIIGEPTGISALADLPGDKDLDLAVAWSLGDKTKFIISSDYLWNKPKLLEIDKVKLDVYYGVGARVQFASSQSYLGPRVPIGIKYLFEKAKIEAFSEAAMIFNVIPSTSVDFNIGIGARYFF